MHDVGITFNDHAIGNLDAADLGHAPGIVATQIEQHQMFGQLFGIGQQLFFQRLVFFFIVTPTPCSGDGSYRNFVVFQSHENFR